MVGDIEYVTNAQSWQHSYIAAGPVSGFVIEMQDFTKRIESVVVRMHA